MVDAYEWGAATDGVTGEAVNLALVKKEEMANQLYVKGNKLFNKRKWAEADKAYTEALDAFGLGASDHQSLPSRRSLDQLSPTGRLLVLHLFCNRATTSVGRGLRQQAVADAHRACETEQTPSRRPTLSAGIKPRAPHNHNPRHTGG